MRNDSEKPGDKDNHDGFPDLLDMAHVMAWLCLLSYVGFVAVVLL